MARLIDADALKEKKVYSHERHEKVVPVAEIDWMPTIVAIPVEWLEAQIIPYGDKLKDEVKGVFNATIRELIYRWQKEQEVKK